MCKFCANPVKFWGRLCTQPALLCYHKTKGAGRARRTDKGGAEMERTKQFAIEEDKGAYTRMVVQEVYEALKEKGYNPIGQIVGYLLSEDPTYITTHQNARIKIQSLDRDELLSELVRYYLHE